MVFITQLFKSLEEFMYQIGTIGRGHLEPHKQSKIFQTDCPPQWHVVWAASEIACKQPLVI